MLHLIYFFSSDDSGTLTWNRNPCRLAGVHVGAFFHRLTKVCRMSKKLDCGLFPFYESQTTCFLFSPLVCSEINREILLLMICIGAVHLNHIGHCDNFTHCLQSSDFTKQQNRTIYRFYMSNSSNPVDQWSHFYCHIQTNIMPNSLLN